VASIPRVSVCIPAYNAEPYIEALLEQVLGQSERDIEVIVVDDQSGDRTLEAVRAFDDQRLQVHRNEHNQGEARTTNRAMGLSRGRFVKIVHSDDQLDEHCLEKMADALDRHPSAGLVFARRRVVVAPGAGREALWWVNSWRELHRGFGELAELNSGEDLFDRWLRAGLHSNWVGEPTSVMMRRSVLERVGLMTPRIKGFVDVDLWARMLLVADAVFLDEMLTTYQRGQPSVSLAVRETTADWLQRLWLLEAMLRAGVEGPRREWLLAMRRNELLETVKETFRFAARGPGPAGRAGRDLASYAGYRLRARLGRPPDLQPSLPPV
jgi:glycosyltransferase involved in cell wall biosynthesis